MRTTESGDVAASTTTRTSPSFAATAPFTTALPQQLTPTASASTQSGKRSAAPVAEADSAAPEVTAGPTRKRLPPRNEERTCEFCGKTFTARWNYKHRSLTRRTTCSQLCRHRLGLAKRRDDIIGQPWSPEELDKLEQLAGAHPVAEVRKRFNTWAVQRGYPRRGMQAIYKVTKQLAGTSRPTVDGWSLSELADALGVSSDRLFGWRDKGYLPRRKSSGRTVVYRRDMLTIARERPWLLGGIDVDALHWLLEDRDWAEAIARDHPEMLGQRRAIIRVSDGKVFPSIAAVNAVMGLTRGHLATSIRRGWLCKGERYVYADEYQPQRTAS